MLRGTPLFNLGIEQGLGSPEPHLQHVPGTDKINNSESIIISRINE